MINGRRGPQQQQTVPVPQNRMQQADNIIRFVQQSNDTINHWYNDSVRENVYNIYYINAIMRTYQNHIALLLSCRI